jgi:gliding motility-associated-like protein
MILSHVNCVGDILSLTYSGTSGNVSGLNYEWKDGTGAVIGNTIGPILINMTTPGTKYYTLKIGFGAGFQCSASITDSVTIYPVPIAAFTVTPNPACAGDPVHIVYNGTTNPTGGTVAYGWLFYGGTPSIASNIGPFDVLFNGPLDSIALNVSQDGCQSGYVTLPLTVNPSPTPVISGVSTLCLQDGSYLYVNPIYNAYNWNTGSVVDSTLIIGGTNTNVYVIVTDANGCKDTAFYTVSSPGALPVAMAGVDTSILLGNSVQLDGSNSIHATSYHWSPGVTLSDSTIVNPIATPDSTTAYVLTVIDANGCEGHDTVIVLVDNTPIIVLPNAFTPNADAQNDLFIPHTKGVDKLLEFTIYNRWGEVVFTTTDLTAGWDGNYKGAPQEMGTYVYAVRAIMKDGTNKNFKGNFMLIR